MDDVEDVWGVITNGLTYVLGDVVLKSRVHIDTLGRVWVSTAQEVGRGVQSPRDGVERSMWLELNN